MFLTNKANGNFVEIMDLSSLFDPFKTQVNGRFHAGEELQDVQAFAKADLMFPSGEALPSCWTDAEYRQAGVRRA